ncbi:sodium/hydrogen exchanger [Caballeronia arationis]|uniref:cation:proton antiporter n=1 Tax=Caballeronia arationis TaxID=1777142 RepID=UPI00074CF96B|nr:cation:proton antiporter [Caballeronia arationis]SAL03817.1 sodium/hydrogen exchanger [Caballeronia arationis]
MTIEAVWFLIVGALLVLMAVGRKIVERLPMTGAMVYLAVGFVLGPACIGLLTPNVEKDVHLLRILTEAGLVVSLFAIGMYLRIELTDSLWRLTLRLAGPAMLITIAVMFVAARWGLGLAAGPALLLASVLAPTDPVLANELRVEKAGDDEPLRFALSSEGGLNDGAASPMVFIALALCGVHSLGSDNPWTFALAILWGLASSAIIGWAFGTGVVALVTRLRTRYDHALGLEGFLALGLVALAYGATLIVDGYAFIAVFVAGVAVRRQEMKATGDQAPSEALEEVERGKREEAAKDPELAHAYMVESMMGFSVEMERFIELGLMLLIGSVVSAHWREMLHWYVIWPVLFLFLVARPIGTTLTLIGSSLDSHQRFLSAWLGLRGVSAFYYLLFCLEQAGKPIALEIGPIVLAAIVLSVILHGTSATVLLDRYFHRRD